MRVWWPGRRAIVCRLSPSASTREPRPHLQRAIVVRMLALHLDLVCTAPAHAHHQMQLRCRRRGILSRPGKAPLKQPMQLDHRRVGDQHVTDRFEHTAIPEYEQAQVVTDAGKLDLLGT